MLFLHPDVMCHAHLTDLTAGKMQLVKQQIKNKTVGCVHFVTGILMSILDLDFIFDWGKTNCL